MAAGGIAYVELAAVVAAMLLLAVRNEWDLITWIAPREDAEHK